MYRISTVYVPYIYRVSSVYPLYILCICSVYPLYIFCNRRYIDGAKVGVKVG